MVSRFRIGLGICYSSEPISLSAESWENRAIIGECRLGFQMTESKPMYINGEWVKGEREALYNVYNPATGEIYCKIADAGRSDTRSAIQAAAAAQPEWAKLPHTKRAAYLLKAADILESRQNDLVNALVDEGGAWIGKGMFEVNYVAGLMRAAAASVYDVRGEIVPSEHGKVSMVVRQPLGVVSVISPWNFPLLLSSSNFVNALVLGNTIVLKPSEETPVSGGLLLAEILEEAGLPKGVFNVVTCSREHIQEVGDELVANAHVKAISFTGSTSIGRKIAAQAGSLLKKTCMGIGGQRCIAGA